MRTGLSSGSSPESIGGTRAARRDRHESGGARRGGYLWTPGGDPRGWGSGGGGWPRASCSQAALKVLHLRRRPGRCGGGPLSAMRGLERDRRLVAQGGMQALVVVDLVEEVADVTLGLA